MRQKLKQWRKAGSLQGECEQHPGKSLATSLRKASTSQGKAQQEVYLKYSFK